ncbi:MAG: hypothetical protein AMJ75_05775 [Phycisphaerae bacterium SM1_79]|nr:MAG: hypothetical protein AMJ75_05775 [Phycisphaerae bacterium SM1_79]
MLSNWDKFGAIIGLVIGVYLILFRKNFANMIIQKQLEGRKTPKTLEYQQQLKAINGEGMLHKGIEIMAIVVGTGFLLLSISEIFPQTNKYVKYLLGLFALSLCAATASAFVELFLLFRFLWRKVRKYTLDHYPDWHCSVQKSYGTDKLSAIRNGPTDDPVLRVLEKKAIIYSIVCFIPLFAFFMLAFYIIYKVTS